MNIEYYEAAASFLRRKMTHMPEIALILGSGAGHFADMIEDKTVIKYKDIPNFLESTVDSHAGKLIFGKVAGKQVVCMSGRFHYYEGYSFDQLAIPVRVLKLLGVRALLLTNAAGGVNTAYRPGDLMVISDHIKLMGASPMRGKNDGRIGPRFFDVTRMYDPALRQLALSLASETSLRVQEGVYFYMPGPQFETPAEIRAIRTLGGDAVGMSTVTEALTAAHCGLPVLGISVITNLAAGMSFGGVSDEEVGLVSQRIEKEFSGYLTKLIERM